jgi:Uma2 family endonuclease
MSEHYEEVIAGETLWRFGPGARHELICARLHALVAASVARIRTTELLPPRTIVKLTPASFLRPDLALITAATGKLWLAAEIINSEDHRPDTVTKKAIYEEVNVPRLWMIDPRYDNVEVYRSSEYGLRLTGILAGREVLAESLLPGFEVRVAELFAA